ncbi:TetR/AcrR family transcriptional regulator [Nocardioides sp. NPDC004968]|uniref:TetR/AcrR family transcriptional regulator n=1 Tax=Nocardioides sp. NPDC004968 TaxID=3155894 RepID=UPI0033A5A5BD
MRDEAVGPSRRDEYAEMTRRDVVKAARALFAEYGYEGTTVAKIAHTARVSPATVYAQCGGKEGLLTTLIDLWAAGPLNRDLIASCASVPTGREKLDALCHWYRATYVECGDILQIVTRAAATAPVAESYMNVATAKHLTALTAVAAQIRHAGDLADGLGTEDAASIIFFHFRYDQYVLCAERFAWGEERTLSWLTHQVATAILRQTV